jgi:hypothetical protein
MAAQPRRADIHDRAVRLQVVIAALAVHEVEHDPGQGVSPPRAAGCSLVASPRQSGCF